MVVAHALHVYAILGPEPDIRQGLVVLPSALSAMHVRLCSDAVCFVKRVRVLATTRRAIWLDVVHDILYAMSTSHTRTLPNEQL